MKSDRIMLKLSEDGKRYLDEIFGGKWKIHNPTSLKINGLGELTATSIVLDNVFRGEIEEYFYFNQEGINGQIIRKNGVYFIERYSHSIKENEK